MAEANRYYWLKLREDFFYKSKRMKKLRRMAGGDTYLIIYLKIQLLAMKTDGILKWTGLEEDFANELALAIDENPDNIKVVLAFLLQYGLAESSDNINFFFPYSVENSGSESSSAQRMRESRASMKALPSQSVHNVQQSDTEIEKEEEIDKREKSTEKEGKKKKADAFSEFAGDDADLLSALRDFEKMRKSIGKPLTDRAKAMLLNKLQTFPASDWIPILDQSIFHNWQGIFELKDNARNSYGKTADMLSDSYDMMKEWANE